MILVVIADSSANPLQIAADLLSQAEQDPTSALILFTSDRQIAATVQAIIQDYFQENPQNILMQKAIAHYGLIVVLDSWIWWWRWSINFLPITCCWQWSNPGT